MCGIVGEVSLKEAIRSTKKELREASALLRHRGPDDAGMYIDEHFICAHRRLSIIDPHPHAKQPMLSDDGSVVLVYNGEIYNYKEIREELISKGYKFKTSSDTEVLLQSYMEFGIACLERFIGMFAFAIYDKAKNECYIVRDRLGVKPLYYFQEEDRIVFASEIKSVLSLGKIKRELNLDALSSYLSFRYPILDDTFFKGVNSLPPAYYIRITQNGIEQKEYWDLSKKFVEQKEDKGETYYIERLRSLLVSSVKLRMRSDVAFGAFLSGGVDSSVITALMAKQQAAPIETFTIGFEEEAYNEFAYARMVASRYSTNHHEILLSMDAYVENMHSLIAFKDAPLSVPNEVALYLMSKELKKYITVVLSGEGADEIFGGYGRIFRSPYDYERIKKIDDLQISDEEKKRLAHNFIKKYAQESFASELDHFLSLYAYTPFSQKHSLLHERIDLKEIEKRLYGKFLGYFETLEGASYTQKIFYVFEKIHLLGLLARVDTTTMAASVEARVPFVDHRLVEFAFTIPVKYKLKWIEEKPPSLMSDAISEAYDIPKYILKKAYESELPKEVLYRKKMGFPVPLHKWFGREFYDFAKKMLLGKKAKERKLYNIDTIRQYLQSDKLGKDHSFAMKLWMLVNVELFMQKYFNEG